MNIFPGSPFSKELNVSVSYQDWQLGPLTHGSRTSVAHASSPYMLWQERANVVGNGVLFYCFLGKEESLGISSEHQLHYFHSSHVLALPTHPT